MSDEKCFKTEPPFFQCCCECQYHLEDCSHPLTDGKSVLEVKGYVCCCYDMKAKVFSGWPKHSIGCELYTKKHKEML